MGTLPAIPRAVPTSALYARGPDETRGRLREVTFDENYAALMIGDLADAFHDAWRKVHFAQRGEGTPHWKGTTDRVWIDGVQGDLERGTSWIRSVPDGSGVPRYEVDIAALKNEALPIDRAIENFASGFVAIRELLAEMQSGVRPDEPVVLRIADHVHAAWLKRNSYVFNRKYDVGQAEDSSAMRLMRKPFSELYTLGATDPQAAAEALKDIEVVVAAMATLNDSFKADLPYEQLLSRITGTLARPETETSGL